MIGLVLVTHGRLAAEFVVAMEHVVGPQEAIEPICIGPDDDMEARRQDIADLMGSVEVFARRQPALFMGAAVALGFALTRVVGAGAVAGDYDDGRYRRSLRTDYGENVYPQTTAGVREQRPDVAQSTPSAAMTGSDI